MTAQQGALNSLRKDDKQSGTHEERGPDVKTSYTTSPTVTTEASGEILWTVDQVRRDAGAAFPRSTGPVQPCPSFFSAAEGRSCGPRGNHQLYNIFSTRPPATRTNTGNDAPRGTDR